MASLESASSGSQWKVGIDVGGTFTDVMLLDEETHQVYIHKLLTDHSNRAASVFEALDLLIADTPVTAPDIAEIRHGTTVVTNAVLARQGARAALVTTQGFRDVLEIGTEARSDMYDTQLEKAPPIIPRRNVYGIDERILADGSVLQELSDDSLETLTRELRAGDYEAVAVCLLHSYTNPEHERRVRDYLRTHLPQLEVSISHDVSPEIREYFRTSTTATNAYVRPLMRSYLRHLQEQLGKLGISAEVFLMLSNGGICTIDTAVDYPVRLIESGPAAGVLAAAEIGKLTGNADILTFDMGGTTAKSGLVIDGEPLYSPTFEVARHYRFKEGSGLPLQVRSIDLIEIGAGGGSIASVNQVGLVQVGPESAESNPGPACYQLGGTRATVTDANLVLGYLDPNSFLGGRMTLDRKLAEQSIVADVGEPLSLDLVHAAEAIRQVVNENMASAARIYSIEHGYEAQSLQLLAFGGAAPAHAVAVARILDIARIIVPPAVGVSSTYGLIAAPFSFDFVRSYQVVLFDADCDLVQQHFTDMEAEGRKLLQRAKIAEQDQSVTYLCDVRFVGQGSELSIEVPKGEIQAATLEKIHDEFIRHYRQLYGRAPESVALELVSLRVVVSGPRPTLRLANERIEGNASKGTRPVYWGEKHGFIDTRVLDRYALAPGQEFQGPLIVEERESTTALDPGSRLSIDEHLNLIIDLVQGA